VVDVEWTAVVVVWATVVDVWCTVVAVVPPDDVDPGATVAEGPLEEPPDPAMSVPAITRMSTPVRLWGTGAGVGIGTTAVAATLSVLASWSASLWNPGWK
jgi:hypothetical protein